MSKYATLKNAKVTLLFEPIIDMCSADTHFGVRPIISGTIELYHISFLPLDIDCSGSFKNGTLNFHMLIDDGATDFCGIKGFDIDMAEFDLSIGETNSCSLSVLVNMGVTEVSFYGNISEEGIGVYTEFDDFTLYDLYNIFKHISGEDFTYPDYDIDFDKVAFSVANADLTVGEKAIPSGIVLTCDIKVHDFSCSATITINGDGVTFALVSIL
jgi:hypothetical protein